MGWSEGSLYEGHQHTAMPQLRPQVLLVWLIHTPALPSEPGAGWGDASLSKQPSPEGSDLPSPEWLGKAGVGACREEDWLGFYFLTIPKEIAGTVYRDGGTGRSHFAGHLPSCPRWI